MGCLGDYSKTWGIGKVTDLTRLWWAGKVTLPAARELLGDQPFQALGRAGQVTLLTRP